MLLFLFTGPNCPPTLHYYLEKGNKRNIRLVWTSPVETLFKTESYDLEITQDEWKNMSTFSLPASALQYVINDFTVDATYRFKIYSVSHLVKSSPTQNTCFASRKLYLLSPTTIILTFTMSKVTSYID